MNILGVEFDYHNIGIFMFVKVKKSETVFENNEPEKCTDWRWVKWNEYVDYPNLFNPFYYFFE